MQFSKNLAEGLTKSKESIAFLKTSFESVKNSCIYGPVTIENRIIIPRNLIDSMLEKLKSDHETMMEQSRTDFPTSDGTKCHDCNYRVFCTKERMNVEGGEEEYD